MAPWTAACQASLSFTISSSLLKLRSIEWVIPLIRPWQMRSIFTQKEEPEPSRPYSTLCWTSTSIFLHFHLPPLPSSSSSLQCLPWGPDWGRRYRRQATGRPSVFHFWSMNTESSLFSPLYFRQFLGLYIWTPSPAGALGLSGPERIYFGPLANRKLVRTSSACLETTNTRINWASLGAGDTAMNKIDENSSPHRAWLLMGSSR